MLSVCRRFFVALLAIALTSQLVQGQLLLCEQMDMSGTSMMDESMPASGHERHDAGTVTSDHGTQTDAPGSSDCVLAASCVNAPAVPIFAPPALDAEPGAAAIPSGTTSAHVLTLRPEPPPPRL